MSTVDEIVRDQSAELTARGWKMSRVWQVTLDSIVWGSISSVEAVRVDTDGADIGDAHPVIASAFLRRLNPSLEGENRFVWRVTGEYEQGVLPSWPGNPLEAPTQVTWGSSAFTAPAVEDIDGNAIVNSAGQPFDPPLTIERRALAATISYNSETFDADQADEFEDSVNIAATQVANLNVGARVAKIEEMGAVKQFYRDIEYWAVTIKVALNKNTWDRQVLDQGIFALDDDDNLVRMATDDGEEVTEPLKLDGSGKKLDPQTANPVYLIYKTFEEKNFATLNLGTP